MNLDVHSHMLPDEAARKLGVEVTESGGLFNARVLTQSIGPVTKGFFDLSARMSELDENRIEGQVISVTHHLFMYNQEVGVAERFAREQNEAIAKVCAAKSDKFVGNGTLPMQDSKSALKELDHVYHDLELRGVEIGTHIAGKNLDSDELIPLYERLQELDMPILVHPGDLLGAERMKKYYMGIVIGTLAETTVAITSIIFGRILERFPRLKFIFCHGGGAVPYQLGRIKRAVDVRKELEAKPSVEEQFRKMYFDTVVFDRASLKFMVDRVGPGKVVFGTDYPFNMGNWDVPSYVTDLQGVADGDKVRMAYGNAKELYKL